MPGAGINAGNIARLRELTGAREFHASAKFARPSAMLHAADPALDMSAGEIRTDAEAVRRLVAALQDG
jgi:copper homeostasis protein